MGRLLRQLDDRSPAGRARLDTVEAILVDIPVLRYLYASSQMDEAVRVAMAQGLPVGSDGATLLHAPHAVAIMHHISRLDEYLLEGQEHDDSAVAAAGAGVPVGAEGATVDRPIENLLAEWFRLDDALRQSPLAHPTMLEPQVVELMERRQHVEAVLRHHAASDPDYVAPVQLPTCAHLIDLMTLRDQLRAYFAAVDKRDRAERELPKDVQFRDPHYTAVQRHLPEVRAMVPLGAAVRDAEQVLRAAVGVPRDSWQRDLPERSDLGAAVLAARDALRYYADAKHHDDGDHGARAIAALAALHRAGVSYGD